MADIRAPGASRKSVRFVDAFLSVITRAIYEPKRIDEQFRPPTPRRKVHGRGASWRDTVGGASWADPANRRAHKKWLKVEKQCAASRAAQDAANHARGESLSHHNSTRTLNRLAERRLNKVEQRHARVSSR